MQTIIDCDQASWTRLGETLTRTSACAIGLLFGGVGLAIYFRTVIDLVVPVAIVVLAAAVYRGDRRLRMAGRRGRRGDVRIPALRHVERESCGCGASGSGCAAAG